jgi:hypothetical protein
MSHEVVAVVSQTYPRGGAERLLAFVLADFAHPAGDRIYPSVATLATRTMQSTRTVQRCLVGMVASGWLEVVMYGAGGRGNTTEYRISAAWLDAAAMEIAVARRERREPRPVQSVLAVVDDARLPGGEVPPTAKGDNLSPFSEAEAGAVDAQKGDKNSVKGDKNDVKGDIAMSPEQRTENKEEYKPPYPPTGGATAAFEKLAAAYPRQQTANLRAARRVFDRVFGDAPDALRVCAALAAIGRDAATPEWQRDGGRWVPKLSTWLDGWAMQPACGDANERAAATAALQDAAAATVAQLARSAQGAVPASAQVLAGLRTSCGGAGGVVAGLRVV